VTTAATSAGREGAEGGGDAGDAKEAPPSVSTSPGWAPPPGRLDDAAARERVMQLASGTAQGAGALEAVQGCMSSMPGITNNRLMLVRVGTLHALVTLC
jgi:hypothetical protein